MIREIGITLFMVGILSLFIILGATGYESPFPVVISRSYYSTQRDFNETKYIVLVSDMALKREEIEGYTYVVDCRVRLYLPPAAGQFIKNVEGKLYLLSHSDYLTLQKLLERAFTKKELESYIPLLEAKKKLALELKEENLSQFQRTMVCEQKNLPPGEYYALIVIKAELSKTGGPSTVPSNYPVKVGADAEIALKAVINPTFIQLFRAIDVTIIGALVLGMHIYFNKEEYRSNRIIRILHRIYDTLNRRRRKEEELP